MDTNTLQGLDEHELANHIDQNEADFDTLETVDALGRTWHLLQGRDDNDRSFYIYETDPEERLAWHCAEHHVAARDAFASTIFAMTRALDDLDAVKALWRGNDREDPTAYAVLVELTGDDRVPSPPEDQPYLLVRRSPRDDNGGVFYVEGEQAAWGEFIQDVRHAVRELDQGDVNDRIAAAGGRAAIAYAHERLADSERIEAGEALRREYLDAQFGRGGDRVTVVEAAALVGLPRSSMYRVLDGASWV